MSGPATDERPALGRDAIVAAARRIADREGLGALTLRRIAAEFGTGQASLYRHIAGRGELLRLLADDLATSYPVMEADATRSIDDVVRQWQALHGQLAAHPWAPRLISDGVYLGQGADETARTLIAQLERIGLDPDSAARTYRALWHLTLGHLLSGHPFGQPHTDDTRHTRRARPAPADSDGLGWELRQLIVGAQTEPCSRTPAARKINKTGRH